MGLRCIERRRPGGREAGRDIVRERERVDRHLSCHIKGNYCRCLGLCLCMCLCPCLLLCCVLVCVCPCLCLCLCGVRSRSGGQEPEGSGRKGRPVRTTSFPVKRNASSQTNLFLLSACRLVGWLVLWLVGWLAGWLVGCLGCSRLGRALVRPGRELVICGLSCLNNKPHGRNGRAWNMHPSGREPFMGTHTS